MGNPRFAVLQDCVVFFLAAVYIKDTHICSTDMHLVLAYVSHMEIACTRYFVSEPGQAYS